ncbi:MAG: hypothetical protein E3J64_10185 [Anaerolineales bacterium]|nr:MAG: hypothetical protein E3J64_10185 [Anaerolineales bacterium]
MALIWRRLLVQMAPLFFAALGTLQMVALRSGLEGLAWPVGPAHKRVGQVLAGSLVALALVGGLLLVSYEPLAPEMLAVVLLAGTGLALGVSIAGAAVRLRWGRRKRRVRLLPGERVEQGPLRAIFRSRPMAKSAPGVCVLPDPTSPSDDLAGLTGALADAGFVVLALDWRSLRKVDRLALQGAVSIGLSWLAQREETDPERIGLVGVGLGGDLALRSAAGDPDVAAVLAIEPVFGRRRPGPALEGLRGLSWFGARRRVRRWRRSKLVKELDGLGAIPLVGLRHVAVVVSERAGPSSTNGPEILRVAGGWGLMACGNAETVERACGWLLEHLK